MPWSGVQPGGVGGWHGNGGGVRGSVAVIFMSQIRVFICNISVFADHIFIMALATQFSSNKNKMACMCKSEDWQGDFRIRGFVS